MLKLMTFAAVVALSPVVVHAQAPVASPVQAAPVPAVLPIAPAGTAVLRVGTEVPLKLSEQLTTKNKVARVGQRFRMETAEDIKVNGVTVIPVGSPAMGEITDVRNKGMWGKSGHINARLLYVQTNGRQIRLSGTFDDKGVTGTAGVVAAIAFIPVAGFFTTGTSANIPVGAGVKGFIDEDVPLAFATPVAQPMQVAPVAETLTVSTGNGGTASTAGPAPTATPAVLTR